MKTAEGLALFAEKVLKERWLYAWGAYGQRLSDIYPRLAASAYYRDKNPTGLTRLKAVLDRGDDPRVVDCHGIKDGYMMTNDDTGALEPRPGVDTSADYDFNRVKGYGTAGIDYGTIDTMPSINQRGLGVWKTGHFGVCVGNNQVIDIYSTANPARIADVSSVRWSHWFKCDGIDYGTTGGSLTMLLKLGSTGDAVRTLQANLNKLINAGLIADGKFGPLTEMAVKNFQRQYGLTADGIVGKQTQAVITRLMAPEAPPVIDYKPALDAANAQIDLLENQLEAVKKALADAQAWEGQALDYKQRLITAAAGIRLLDAIKTDF